MPKINVLPKEIAELIAAGEVIERPSSVIKELLENSVDSGAKNIIAEIKNGGVTFLRVTDDGCGFFKEDIKNAFLRHATSKIATTDDLFKIGTLGFRGEALPSICAMSRVELITKTKDEDFGSRYEISA
ncbi:MAG: DNA mismatch repair endonuclease MutL, partial [Oscillospiraceae bacterium]